MTGGVTEGYLNSSVTVVGAHEIKEDGNHCSMSCALNVFSVNTVLVTGELRC